MYADDHVPAAVRALWELYPVAAAQSRSASAGSCERAASAREALCRRRSVGDDRDGAVVAVAVVGD